MASVAVEQPLDRAAGVNRAGRRAVLLLAVLALLWGLWEGFRALGTHFGWTHPFTVDATTMPHIHEMIRALFERAEHAVAAADRDAPEGGALHRASEAGARLRDGRDGRLRARRRCSRHSRMLQRGLLPYVVASQTVPILAIAPMVVIWLGSRARRPPGSPSR